MAVAINKLRGVTWELEARLKLLGVYHSDQLLEKVRTPATRTELAQTLGIEPRAMLDLSNRADLARVRGIGGVFSDLLERAGVDTVVELASRNPDNLYAKLVTLNVGRRFAGRAPTLKAVHSWVEQAKQLGRALEY